MAAVVLCVNIPRNNSPMLHLLSCYMWRLAQTLQLWYISPCTWPESITARSDHAHLTLTHHNRVKQTHKKRLSPESWKRLHTFTPSSSRVVSHLDPVFFRPVYHSPPPFFLPLVFSDPALLLLVVGLLWSKAWWLMACSVFNREATWMQWGASVWSGDFILSSDIADTHIFGEVWSPAFKGHTR